MIVPIQNINYYIHTADLYSALVIFDSSRKKQAKEMTNKSGAAITFVQCCVAVVGCLIVSLLHKLS